jgi:hypothetical protein
MRSVQVAFSLDNEPKDIIRYKAAASRAGIEINAFSSDGTIHPVFPGYGDPATLEFKTPQGSEVAAFRIANNNALVIRFGGASEIGDDQLAKFFEDFIWRLPDFEREELTLFIKELDLKISTEVFLALPGTSPPFPAAHADWMIKFCISRFFLFGKLTVFTDPSQINSYFESLGIQTYPWDLILERASHCSLFITATSFPKKDKSVLIAPLGGEGFPKAFTNLRGAIQIPLDGSSYSSTLLPLPPSFQKQPLYMLHERDRAFAFMTAHKPGAVPTVDYSGGVKFWKAPTIDGPREEIIFRISENIYHLSKRSSHTVCIAFFGGSACRGEHCAHPDTITAILERKLNAVLPKNRRVAVLNYGLAGALQIDEMDAFMKYCISLRPEIVVSHSFANDCWQGLACDPYALRYLNLIYSADKLYNAFSKHSDVENSRSDRIFQSKVFCTDIIRTYQTRLKVFASVAHTLGSFFIFGRQPIGLRRLMSHQEIEADNYCFKTPNLSQGHVTRYNMVQNIYEAFGEYFDDRQGTQKENTYSFIDVHKIFYQQTFNEKSYRFANFFHTTGEANNKIADIYFDNMMSNPITKQVIFG